MRVAIVTVGLLAGCTVQNPWFELAGQSETTAGTGAGTGGETLVPTTQASTDEPATTATATATTTVTATSASTGPVTATEAGTTTSGTDTGEVTGGSVAQTGPDETGMPAPDMGGLCGDEKADANEACDDGNLLPGDGCEANCQFMFGYAELGVFTSPRDIGAADLDGDGKVDLVVTHPTDGIDDPDFTLLINKGAGTFQGVQKQIEALTGGTWVRIGQMAEDARVDLLFVSAPTGKLLTLVNKSTPGNFAFVVANGFVPQALGLVTDAALADLDSDGFDDVVLVVGEKLYVHMNDGVGGLAPAVGYGLDLKMPTGVAAGMLVKADPKTHLAVIFAALEADMTGYLNDGAGNLSKKNDTGKHCPTGATAVRAGDADHAGPIDLVVGCASGRVALVGHDGKLPYERVVEDMVSAVASVGVIDLYGGDEAIDVYGTLPTKNGVLVGVQQGKKFVATHTEILAESPTTSAVLDFDGDEAPDIAVVLPKANKVGLLRNQTRD